MQNGTSCISEKQGEILDIAPDQIVFNISNTLHGITATWRTPDNNNKISPSCYEAEVQYKNQCVKDWKGGQSIQVRQQHEVYNLDLSTLSMKTNYDFRIRMKLGCLDKDWSKWTKVQSWGNNEGACMVEGSAYIWVYILIIVLPLTAFLLVCLLTQQGVRRLIFPEVPDPKHFKNKIMDTEQSQWWGNLTQWNEECSTTDIEIIDKNEREEQHQTLVIQPMYTSPEQHDSMYRIYSSETPGEITEVQYSRSVLGYIAF
ncbi:cytokine receptor common subunit gamma-like [Sinocyclocheilus anshuiensis]|uniref:cytokine receptor common subunit gamma-like n=1 Tax=Sinocyclocheilus anshuiensis TaxID=1608454 RepID=UPI0007B9E5ED|nr:PREDICTED: cytokine receptor common subunit gamma-like [Sinocyclocheilus anshuiensis]